MKNDLNKSAGKKLIKIKPKPASDQEDELDAIISALENQNKVLGKIMEYFSCEKQKKSN